MEWGLLSALTDEDRETVLTAARQRTFSRGEVLVHEGDLADSLHLIAAGRAAVTTSAPSGARVMLNILSPGDYFGELSLVRHNGERRRTASVHALEQTQTLVISAETFDALRTRDAAFEQLLVAALSRRVEQLSGRLLDALYLGLDRRLYRCLVDLTHVYGGDDEPAAITLTQDQLADLVGGTRPTVNQVLRKLSDQRVVDLERGRIVVRDLAQLRRKAAL